MPFDWAAISYHSDDMNPKRRVAVGLFLTAWPVCGRALDAAPPKASSTMPVIDRLRLGVRDLPAAVSWLDKTLGWKPSYRDGRRAVIATGGEKLQLDAADADSTATIALASKDADVDYLGMIGRGAASIEAPSDRPSGFREAYLRGPGGLVFEIEGPLAAPPEFIYTEIVAGTGETPKPSDTVKVRYVGALKDGTIFDDAHRHGRPAMIPLGSAIRCWTQALGRMKVGGRSKFVCPPEMAYGRDGKPPRIPANAALVFEVELAGVIP